MDVLRRTIYAGVMCAAGVAAGGCLGPRQTQPSVDPAQLSDQGFLNYISEVPVVTVAEAYRAMLILADGHDDAKSFEERESKLFARHIASPAWCLKPDHVIDQGAVAAMAARIMGIRGGINREVFGAIGLGDRRYANRELIYRDMLPWQADYTGMRGGPMAGLIQKADAYLREHGRYETQKIELGSESQAIQGG